MAFTHYTPFTVNTSQITGTLTNHTAIIAVTDNRFKLIANGGRGANASGFDWRPYPLADTGLTTPLAFKLVAYDGTAGFIHIEVMVASFAVAAGINLAGGNSSLTTDGSTTGAYDSNTIAIYQMTDVTGGAGTVLDSGPGARHLDPGGSPTNAAGPFGSNAGVFNGTTQYIHKDGVYSVDPILPNTLSTWFKTSVATGTLMRIGVNTGSRGLYLTLRAGNKLDAVMSGTIQFSQAISSASYTNNVWSHGGGTFTSRTNHTTYLNGAIDTNQTLDPGTIDSDFITLAQYESGSSFYAGSLARARVDNAARSSAWWEAEYNMGNQGAFWTMGAEVSILAAGAAYLHYAQLRR